MKFSNSSNDVFFENKKDISYSSLLNKNIEFINNFDLKNPVIWKRFVEQFRTNADSDFGWRGEYWGKMMRGACFVYSYTKDRELFETLKTTVIDMINSADNFGRISTYPLNMEFTDWDIWCRKYVLLGMQYFLEINDDKSLNLEIIESMSKQTDYIISKVGDKNQGKLPITSTTRYWRGLNSSSLLEPIVRLYSITKKEKYLEFAKHIVNSGGTEVANIFDLAYNKGLRPYQYPMTKAYEMTSCFLGLLEYYRITGDEYYKTAVINFADCILDDEFTVIGSAGCTHELFDHSAVRQANTTNGTTAQETCVTVTLMQFFYQLNLLTGDSKYMDAFEISLYNAYLGAVNTEKNINKNSQIKEQLIAEPLPFDSYSPLTKNKRGILIGGFKVMSDMHYYGCCACMGSAGIGLAMKSSVLASVNGIVLNLFEKGKIIETLNNGKTVELSVDTEYPVNDTVKISVLTNGEYNILIRNPYWSENTIVYVNNEIVKTNKGYIELKRNWKTNDEIKVIFDFQTKVIKPIPYGSQAIMNEVIWDKNYMVLSFDKEDPIAKNHIAIRRGPLMLAQDERLGYNLDNPISLNTNNIMINNTSIPYPCILKCEIETENGKFIKLTDYASAGKDWKSKIAVWMLTK